MYGRLEGGEGRKRRGGNLNSEERENYINTDWHKQIGTNKHPPEWFLLNVCPSSLSFLISASSSRLGGSSSLPR